MITSAICTSYKREILSGLHQPGDTYKIALFDDGALLDAETEQYISAHEISGPGYTAGGQELAGFAVGGRDGVAWLDFADVSWPNAAFSAAGALIYNASKQNRAVAVMSFGGVKSRIGEPFTIDFPIADPNNAFLRI